MNESVSKEIRINVRTREDIKRDIEITARLRGIKVSSLVNQLLMQAIREEKQKEPLAFIPKQQPANSANSLSGGKKIAPNSNKGMPKQKTKEKEKTAGKKAA